MEVYLETERLLLRRFTEDDVDLLVELDGDPDVMRYLTGGAPTPRATIRDEILPAFLRYYARPDGYGFWAVIEKATGDFLGWFHFRPAPGAAPDEPELGYRLLKTAWGQGYGTEGARALIRKGFTELGARRVVASTYQDNRASRRVMEKAGMTFVRAYHPTPEELAALGVPADAPQELFAGDDVEYAIERDDWVRREGVGAP